MLKVAATTPEIEPNEFDAARERYASARRRQEEIKSRILQIERAQWSATDNACLDAAADAWLDGAPQAGDSYEPEPNKLRAERDVVFRAVEVARKRYYEAREARNREVVSSLRPAHCQAAARVAACLVELAEANAEEARIRARAPSGALPFLSYPGVDLGRQDTTAKHFLSYARRHGIEPAPRSEAAE